MTLAYGEWTPEELQNEWLEYISKEIHKAEIPKAKKDKMVQPYSTIAAHPELGKATKAYPKGILYELIRRLDEKVWPFISVYYDFDVVGQFYGEFLKYTGGDKKALGIVLTPRHITELFALLANVTKGSRVLDICAGTAGFLISAMHQMMRTAVTEKDKEKIRRIGLVGVEQQPNMFALAASNMILRGDGKANLYQGSCFDPDIAEAVKSHKCNAGMLNPPFSQGDNALHELYFIKQMLNCLTKGGVGISLAPMTCAIAAHPAREELLRHHTLEAVVTLPDELFYPVGAVPCAMVFTAKIPHAVSDRKTWFGYWRDDGFVKTKHRGRVDLHGGWPAIRDRWVSMFRNREVHPGESVLQKVGPTDEWCAEAYMGTDYSKLDQSDFEEIVKNYAVFQFSNAPPPASAAPQLDPSEWKPFRLSDLFDVHRGQGIANPDRIKGSTPYIGALRGNNGLVEYIDQAPMHKGGTITLNWNGIGGVGYAFYQPRPYWCSGDVNALYPRFDMTPAVAHFIVAIIRKERFRFSFGRKMTAKRIGDLMIKLPAYPDGTPDWVFMEQYVKALPFSSYL